MSVTPEQCVKGALNSVGRVRASYGTLKHNIFAIICSLIPEYLMGKINDKFSSKALLIQEE